MEIQCKTLGIDSKLFFFSKNEVIDVKDKKAKWHCEIQFDGVMSHRKLDVQSFKAKEVMFDRPTYLGSTILELCKLLMNLNCQDILQLFFDPNVG